MLPCSPSFDTPTPRRRVVEDVADWEVRMTSGEVVQIFKGVVVYGADRYSIYLPECRGPDGLLFSAPIIEVSRVRRMTESTKIIKDAQAA